MAKKCLVVSHATRQYRLQFQDLTKIIFRERRSVPQIPTFQLYSKTIDISSEDDTEASFILKEGGIWESN